MLPSSSFSVTSAVSGPPRLTWPACDRALQRQQFGAGLVDIDIDRIEGGDGGQRSGLLAVTSAPSVTVEAPMRPLMGATMRV